MGFDLGSTMSCVIHKIHAEKMAIFPFPHSPTHFFLLFFFLRTSENNEENFRVLYSLL